MYVTYQPEDGEPQTWEFLPDRVRSNEQAIVEKQYGGSWKEFVAGLMTGRATARRVLLCHLIRREHPAHQLRDTPDFMGCELLVEQSPTELQKTYDVWVAGGGREGESGELLESMFLADIAEATAKFGEPEGKAPSKSEPAPTPGP